MVIKQLYCVRLFVYLLLAFCIWISTPVALADSTPQNPSQVDLLVIDSSTQKPLAGAAVLPVFDNRRQPELLTGPDGHVIVPLPAQSLHLLMLNISDDGWVAKSVYWDVGHIPSTNTVALDLGEKLSGKVVDDTGNPVAGAHVVIRFEDVVQNPNEGFENTATVITGDDGVWTYDSAPASMKRVAIGAWDYDYVTGAVFDLEPTPVSELLNGSDTLTLQSGISVLGSVLNPDGKPVRNAQITLGAARYGSNATVPPERTDRSGEFSFAAAAGQQVVVTVQAKGYAPELQQFIMGQQSPPALIFNLQPPHDISGTVVDEHGKPIPNAWIHMLRWRGFYTLPASTKYFLTDSDGHFDWPVAPADTIYAQVQAQGYGFIQEVALTPDHPVVITLQSQQVQHIRGTVIDATTGKPVVKFFFAIGYKYPNGSQIGWNWFNREVKTYPGGHFDYPEISGPYEPSNSDFEICIQANGYLPAVSKVYSLSNINSNAPLILKLTPGKDVTATVLNPDGTPAVGAEAHLVFADGQPLWAMINVDVTNKLAPSNAPYAATYPPVIASNAGSIDFPPQIGAFKILVFDSSGVTIVDRDDLEKSSIIELQPWGVIKGSLVLGNDSVSEKSIYFAIDPHDPNADIYRSFRYSDIKTDDNGQFAIDYVPPGKWLACLAIATQESYGYDMGVSPSFPQQTVQIKAGQITDVNLGGMGRTVVGHVLLPSDLSSQTEAYYLDGQVETTTDEPPRLQMPPMPPDVKNGSVEKRFLWFDAFRKSPAGKAFIAAQNNYYQQPRFIVSYEINVRSDGYFIIHGVLPGTYSIAIQMRTPNNEVPAAGEAQFTMPAIPGGVSDEVLVVPTIQLKTSQYYNVSPSLNSGEVAPDFSVKTLDGGTLKLSDFRGKYVLLFVWGTFDPYCLTQIPTIKSMYKTLSSNSNFVMIGLDVDDTPQPAQDYAAKNGLSWLQGYVGPWIQRKTPIMDQYKVQGMPWYCLIGPDGRIIITDYDITRIQTTVESLLKQ